MPTAHHRHTRHRASSLYTNKVCSSNRQVVCRDLRGSSHPKSERPPKTPFYKTVKGTTKSFGKTSISEHIAPSKRNARRARSRRPWRIFKKFQGEARPAKAGAKKIITDTGKSLKTTRVRLLVQWTPIKRNIKIEVIRSHMDSH